MLRYVTSNLPAFVSGLRQANRKRSLVVGGEIRPDYITSNQNEYVKHCVKLRQSRKYRSTHNTTLLVGLTVISEHLLQNPLAPKVVRILTDDIKKLPDAVKSLGPCSPVSNNVMTKVAGLQDASSIQAVAEISLPSTDIKSAQLPSDARVLVLECVQDPGNLGSLIRTAAGLGWNAVWLTHDCCDPFMDKAMRASRGAVLRIKIGVAPVNLIMEECAKEQLQLLAAAPRATPSAPQLEHHDALSHVGRGGVALVMGSEGLGLSPAVLRECSAISLPMSNDIESLNVAAAGAILMHLLSGQLGPTVLEAAALICKHKKHSA